MNQKIRKTALLMGACSLLGAYSPVMAAHAEASVQAVQQSKKITGTVSDAMGPVIGASVVVKGTSNGVATDFDGKFSLNVNPGQTLVISYIGYITKEVKVDSKTSYSITLEEDKKMLDEAAKKCSKSVVQKDEDGSVVAIWASAAEIERNLGINHVYISRACHSESGKLCGYVWEFA